MKPKDIKVGQIYANRNHKGARYLGVGMAVVGQRDEFTNKGLVIIGSKNCMQGYLYQLPQNPPTEQDIRNWDGFYRI